MSSRLITGIVIATILLVTVGNNVHAAKRTIPTDMGQTYIVRFFYESTEELPASITVAGVWQIDDEINKLSALGYDVVSVVGVTGRSDARNQLSRLSHIVIVLKLRRTSKAGA